MAAKQYIVLMDADGQARYFDADDLCIQLTKAGIATGAEAVKAAVRQFSTHVHAMRRAQRTAGFDRADLERRVDGLLPVFNQTLEKL